MTFAKWIDTFLKEKGIDPEEILEVPGVAYAVNMIPVEHLATAMKQAPVVERRRLKAAFVRLDFANQPIRPFLAHLAQAIAL